MFDQLLRYVWIKHPRSKTPDTMLTLSVLSTFAVLGKFLISGASVTVDQRTVNFGTCDSGVVAAIMASTLSAYVARKHKDSPDAKAPAAKDTENAQS